MTMRRVTYDDSIAWAASNVTEATAGFAVAMLADQFRVEPRDVAADLRKAIRASQSGLDVQRGSAAARLALIL